MDKGNAVLGRQSNGICNRHLLHRPASCIVLRSASINCVGRSMRSLHVCLVTSSDAKEALVLEVFFLSLRGSAIRTLRETCSPSKGI